jgi:GTP-binding protein
MRREGFELEIGPPTVIYKGNAESGDIEELWEITEIRVREE